MKRTVTKIRRLFLPRGVCNIGLGTSGIKPDAIERWQRPEGFKTFRDEPLQKRRASCPSEYGRRM